MHQKEMNPGCRVQDQLNTSKPTASYIIGRELNLRKLPGRQWDSNPQPSKQLRPMTIKTSASTETKILAKGTFIESLPRPTSFDNVLERFLSDSDVECHQCVVGNELAHNHIGYRFVIMSDNEVEYVTARVRSSS